MAGTDHESDKLPRLLWLTWWRRRARTQDRGFSQSQFTTHTLLNRAGHISAGAFFECSEESHIRLGQMLWTWTWMEGKRACERSTGPPQKSGADMRKLANLTISGDPLCTAGPIWPREGTLKTNLGGRPNLPPSTLKTNFENTQ